MQLNLEHRSQSQMQNDLMRLEFLVSLNAFREHMTDDGRIHAIITHGVCGQRNP